MAKVIELRREPEMSESMIKQALSEWMSTYTEEHLKGFEGEVLEEQQAWCRWLQEQAPKIFLAYLLEEGLFATSVQTLQEWWELWFNDNLFFLAEEWRDKWL